METRRYPDNPDYSVTESGVIVNTVTGHLLAQREHKINGKGTGYYYVTLGYVVENYRWKHIAVHRIVAKSFLPNPDNKPEVNHKDRNRGNNNVSNLEWVTHSENIIHSYANGRKSPSGVDHWSYNKQISDSTKAKMSAAKKGKAHPKYKGFYIVYGKKFYSSTDAANEFGLYSKLVLRRCADERYKDFSFVPDPGKRF